MKLVPLTEIENQNLTVDQPNKWLTEEINAAKTLAASVSEFYPAQVILQLREKESGGFYIEFCHVILNHDTLDLNITKYKGKYRIFDRSIHKNRHVSTSDKSRVAEYFKAPNAIGVLNKKKISDWIQYHESVSEVLQKLNSENQNKKELFLESIKGFERQTSKDCNSGTIRKNGLVFSYRLEENHVSTRIELDTRDNSFETFLKLANNALNA